MTISSEVQEMYCVAKGAGVARHENAPIPEEGKWIHAIEIKISAVSRTVSVGAPLNKALVSFRLTLSKVSFKKRSLKPSVARV